jgi:hypothetical protein
MPGQYLTPNKNAMKIILFIILLLIAVGLNEAISQWSASGTNIYNTNSGNVGIGTSSPSTLLHVAKNMSEPAITIQNPGGSGGATYRMTDNASGADWKFKATNAGGFKIRDNSNGLDVFVIEPNSAANAIYVKSGGNVGIGTSAPHNSALVDMTSTTKGFLTPRMTQAQILQISNPANGFIVFCTSNNKFYAYLEGANTWKEISYGSATISPPSSCAPSITINHVEGAVAPVTKTVTYGIVDNIPGEPSKCWISSNLGADHQAYDQDDDLESSAGWYWQFNRMQGYKHDGYNRTPNTTWITSINENSEWIAPSDPCALELGSGWRLPTSTEWTNVDAGGIWYDWNIPWNSALKMHAAGEIYMDGAFWDRGSAGYYWSSSQSSNSVGWSLLFFSWDCTMDPCPKANGLTIRCLHD